MNNHKQDRRVKYTHMVLKQSLLKMLQVKPIQKITVKELCEDADINRSTFYAHYIDCYDLLEKMENELFDEMISLLGSYTFDTVEQLLQRLFEAVKEHGDICKIIFADNSYKRILQRLIGAVKGVALEEWRYLGVSEDMLEKLYIFVVNGCVGVIQYWVKSDFKESPAKIATFVGNVINQGVNGLFADSEKVSDTK